MLFKTWFFYNGFGVEGFAYIPKNAGPGQSFDKYLPKAENFLDKLLPSFIIEPDPPHLRVRRVQTRAARSPGRTRSTSKSASWTWIAH